MLTFDYFCRVIVIGMPVCCPWKVLAKMSDLVSRNINNK